MVGMPMGVVLVRGRAEGQGPVEVRWGVVLGVGLEDQVVRGEVRRVQGGNLIKSVRKSPADRWAFGL